MENYKNIEHAIQIIKQLEEGKFNYSFTYEKIGEFKSLEGKLSKNKDKGSDYLLEEVYTKSIPDFKQNNIALKIDYLNIRFHGLLEINLIAEIMYLKSYRPIIFSDDFYNYITKFELPCFHTENYQKNSNYFYRIFIPSSKSYDNLNDFFELSSFSTSVFGKKVKSNECFFIHLEDIKFEVYQHNQDNVNYIIIETKKSLNYDVFWKNAYTILVSLGFITGKLFLNNGYFFAYDDDKMTNTDKFYYSSFGNHIFTDRQPLNNSKKIPSEILTKLCDLVAKSDNKFLEILLLLQEAMESKNSLLLQPVGLYVVLEKLSKLVYTEKAIKPIEDALFKELKTRLLEVISTYSSNENNNFKPIKSKIENMNSPTSKDSFVGSFNLYKIPITKEDENTLNARNLFLHGSAVNKYTPLQLFKLCLRLYLLLSMLIFKYIGFNGEFNNYVNHFFPDETNEEDYRKNY
jgi:hypothetical protein